MAGKCTVRDIEWSRMVRWVIISGCTVTSINISIMSRGIAYTNVVVIIRINIAYDVAMRMSRRRSWVIHVMAIMYRSSCRSRSSGFRKNLFCYAKLAVLFRNISTLIPPTRWLAVLWWSTSSSNESSWLRIAVWMYSEWRRGGSLLAGISHFARLLSRVIGPTHAERVHTDAENMSNEFSAKAPQLFLKPRRPRELNYGK